MALLTGSRGELLGALLSSQPYKPGQGSRARYGTLGALAVVILYGGNAWVQVNIGEPAAVRWGIPFVGVVVSLWVAYRLVHYPRFADFLISTEAEMNKVSWPGKQELRVSTAVVLISVILMGFFLFAADVFWRLILRILGVLEIGGLMGGGSDLSSVPIVPWVVDLVRSVLGF
jgi:preprotein translocase subunit SecE